MPAACIPISCSVLSLRDSCVMYPCCLNCVTRLQKNQSDVRCSCPKCGFTCTVQDVNYRYRLSLNVKRNSDIFGVTVFGSCLNLYFGIPAVGLQRFLDESKKKAGDPQGGCVHSLLIKAVEDCFVGRRFEFGIKPSRREVGEGTLFNERRLPTLLNCNSGGFLASWIALPNGAVGGSPVFRYFERLLKAARLTDLSVSLHPGERPDSPERDDPTTLKSFECSSTSFRGSPSQHSHGTPRFPGLWLRSPGIITSSAEQEEHSCSETDGTALSSQRRCRKSHRSPHKCTLGTPSRFLTPQDVPLDAEGDVREPHSFVSSYAERRPPKAEQQPCAEG
ncbi:hypothetical protein AAFF_G00313270 [Aldrovandia affinis]|uniref:Replication factor A C-terminal domain-containing protein n=1 Tax=Aldrovandia affinis TaxID=143900 RepID=A0AAD7SNH9_9TELE|nr:hypothetical protein AAFF_G00313270 [Aldrovandia affinis]